MKKKVNAIIQARMGSTRLPGKILMNIEDKPILEHIINRIEAIDEIDEIIVATSVNPADNAVQIFCKKNHIQYVRGSEENVLERFARVAKSYPADIYIRATADNPMIDIKLISSMLTYFEKLCLTYTVYKNYPIGSGVEIFTVEALNETLLNATEPYELEHVTPYMYQRMKNKKVEYYLSPADDSKIRMTIDTEQDLLFAKEIFSRLYGVNPLFGIEDIKRILEINPQLSQINSEIHQKILGE